MPAAQLTSLSNTYRDLPLSIVYCELPIIKSRILTYSDGARHLIDYSGLLETLSVYYNKIWLPYPYGLTMDKLKPWRFSPDEDDTRRLTAIHDAYDVFYNRYRLLFDEGILQTVPRTIGDEPPADFESTIMQRLSGRGVADLLSGDFTLAVHACYAPRVSPDFFPFSGPRGGFSKSDTAWQAWALSLGWSKYMALFTCVVPRLPALNAEQVLDLRTDVNSSRQGFVDCLSELSDEVEERLADGANPAWGTIREAFNHQAMLKYQEYQRKLESKSSLLKYAMSQGKPIAQIDTMPWTPKFWYMLVKSLTPLSVASGDKINDGGQAFKFVYNLRRNP